MSAEEQGPRELPPILSEIQLVAAELRQRRGEIQEAERAHEAAQAKHGERLVELSNKRDALRRELFARLNIATNGGWYTQ